MTSTTSLALTTQPARHRDSHPHVAPDDRESDQSLAGNYPNCFGCGVDNPTGLHLELKLEGDLLTTEFIPERRHEGWPGIVHGGVIGAVLYEVMENWAYLNGITSMMRSMDTNLKAPARTGESIRAVSWLNGRDGRELSVAGRLSVINRTIAEGTASLVELSPQQKRRLGIQSESRAETAGGI